MDVVAAESFRHTHTNMHVTWIKSDRNCTETKLVTTSRLFAIARRIYNFSRTHTHVMLDICAYRRNSNCFSACHCHHPIVWCVIILLNRSEGSVEWSTHADFQRINHMDGLFTQFVSARSPPSPSSVAAECTHIQFKFDVFSLVLSHSRVWRNKFTKRKLSLQC